MNTLALTTLAWSLLLAPIASADAVTGVWKVRVGDEAGAPAVPSTFYLLVDPEAEELWIEGVELDVIGIEVSQASVQFRVALEDGFARFQGTLDSEGNLRGTVRFGEQTMAWIGLKVTVFKCGNHSPAHAADSAKEVKSLTREHGCSEWSGD